MADGGRHSPKEHESITAAKIARWATIVVAIIGAVGGIVVAIISAGSKDSPRQGSPGSTSPKGAIGQVTVSNDGTQVTVKGEAEKDVHTVVVLVGPRPGSASNYWAAGSAWDTFTDPGAHSWNVIVNTDPHLPAQYQVKAYFDTKVTIDGGPGPPTPPDISWAIKEAIACGDRCFGSPAVYKGS
jgi:hypothetical protein